VYLLIITQVTLTDRLTSRTRILTRRRTERRRAQQRPTARRYELARVLRVTGYYGLRIRVRG
jgi:hypothetical protein